MGIRSEIKRVRYKGQKYAELHKQQVKVSGLFVDPLFPTVPPSIGNSTHLSEGVEWKRPKELCESPHLLVADSSPCTVLAGKLSCRWFVSACTVLAGIGVLCRKVIPDYWKQEWDPEKKEDYVGIFHFTFWRFGEWVDVVIDDFLPTYEKSLIGTHSNHADEFWIPLVEKAYAKLHGSYEALQGGHLADALVDFTGGVSEIMDLKSEDYSTNDEKRSSLLTLLMREVNNHSLLCATIAVTDQQQEETRTDVGLYRGCVYTVNAVKKVHVGETSLRSLFKGREKLAMIRLREPFEENYEPNNPSKRDASDGDKSSGRGSSKSGHSYAFSSSKLTRLLSHNPEWASIKDSELNRMGLTCDAPGEIWMPFEDFVSNFTELTICRMYNTNVFALSRTWRETSFKGEWSTGAKDTLADRAGGSDNFPETFLRNPQYMFDIRQPEQEMILQMLQWDSTGQHQAAGIPQLLIAFYIIKVEENRKYRLHKQWEPNPTVVSYNPIRKREIFYQGHLPRGRYIIIATTHKPGDIGGYFIRTFTSSDINLRLIKRNVPRKNWFCFNAGYPIWVTVIKVKGAENVMKFDRIGSSDPFCVIKCESKKVVTQIVRNTTHPTWDSAFIFYRSKIDAPILIQVFSHNMVMPNKFAGQVQLPAPVNQNPSSLRVDLMGRGKGEGEPTQGTLVLEVFTTDNFFEI